MARRLKAAFLSKNSPAWREASGTIHCVLCYVRNKATLRRKTGLYTFPGLFQTKGSQLREATLQLIHEIPFCFPWNYNVFRIVKKKFDFFFSLARVQFVFVDYMKNWLRRSDVTPLLGILTQERILGENFDIKKGRIWWRICKQSSNRQKTLLFKHFYAFYNMSQVFLLSGIKTGCLFVI